MALRASPPTPPKIYWEYWTWKTAATSTSSKTWWGLNSVWQPWVTQSLEALSEVPDNVCTRPCLGLAHVTHSNPVVEADGWTIHWQDFLCLATPWWYFLCATLDKWVCRSQMIHFRDSLWLCILYTLVSCFFLLLYGHWRFTKWIEWPAHPQWIHLKDFFVAKCAHMPWFFTGYKNKLHRTSTNRTLVRYVWGAQLSAIPRNVSDQCSKPPKTDTIYMCVCGGGEGGGVGKIGGSAGGYALTAMVSHYYRRRRSSIHLIKHINWEIRR